MTLREQALRLARRVDGLGLRERCMLFASIALLMAAAADSLVLSPALAEQKRLGAQLKQQNTELAALRAQLALATTPPAADSPVLRLRRATAGPAAGGRRRHRPTGAHGGRSHGPRAVAGAHAGAPRTPDAAQAGDGG
jgi:hypothetical protein